MSTFAPIPEIVQELRRGGMIILVDDEQRENEGDLIVAAEKATPEAINFMAAQGRGLICLALDSERCRRLGLDLMVPQHDSKFSTAFTVSVDAAEGISTGISAADRARTVRAAVAPGADSDDLVRPGHIFPVRARDGGTLVRAGHTEGAVDLARLAGLTPAGVICEIMSADGTMARVPELEAFARTHGLKMASIADLIEHRRQTEQLIEKIVDVTLPTAFGDFRLHCYRSLLDTYLHLALTRGLEGEADQEPVLVRVHSECLTGDIFHSLRCDCGSQLEEALRMIAAADRGVLLYLRQEGRGIGLINKLKTYALQERGADTVDANLQLGLPADLREYGIGAQILFDLGVRRLSLLTNNPKKIRGLGGYGLEVVEQLPIEFPPNPHNARYLEVKRSRMGHLLHTDGDD